MVHQLPGITSSKDLRPNTILTRGMTCGHHKPHSIIRLGIRCTRNKSPTWHACPNWASQPHIPVEDYQELRIRNEGEKETSIKPRGAQRNYHAIQQKGDSRFQLSDKTECISIALGKTSQPPQPTWSSHSRKNHTNNNYEATCTLV